MAVLNSEATGLKTQGQTKLQVIEMGFNGKDLKCGKKSITTQR